MIAINKTTDIGFRIQVVYISPLYLKLEIKQAFRGLVRGYVSK